MQTLDERNFDLTRILYNLKQSLDLHKVIGLNAKQIESIGVGKSFFGHVQHLAKESIAINVCKLFEIQRSYPLNSIHGILRFIQDNQISYKSIEPVKNFVQKYGQQIEESNVIQALSLVLNDFVRKHDNDLERFKNFRNKRLAHAENIAVTRNTFLPSPAVIKEFLDFGIDFYSSVHESYMGGGPVQHEHEKRVSTSAIRLLEKIGLQDVKKEFES